MNKTTFEVETLDLDRLEWLSPEDYDPPLNKVCAARWESGLIEGLYSLALVTWDGEKWHFVSDGGEADVKEFAEVEE